MANIKLISVDITGDKELVNVLRSFSKLVTLEKDKKTLESRQQEQIVLKQAETLLGSRLGAKILGGKIGQEEVVDFGLTPASPLIKLLYNKVFGNLRKEERFGATRIEFKASTEGEITVGQITLGGRDSTFAVPGTGDVLTEDELYKNLGISGKGYLLDLDTRAPSSGDITNLVFDEYFRLDKKLEAIFYNKARNMILSTTSTSSSGTINRLAVVQFPKEYFNKEFFKASRAKNAIVISINTNFQRYIQNTLNDSHLEAIKRIKPIRKNFTANGKQYGVDFLSRNILEGSLTYGFEVTNSLKTRPADTFFVSFTGLPKQEKQQQQRIGRQKFISGVQWTALTQKRLGETMLRLGEPEPPELKERTGRFRDSVQVFVNYRTRILQYTYNPLYRSLQKYGYKPDLQVETAIRQVAQQLYAQKFNITRVSRV